MLAKVTLTLAHPFVEKTTRSSYDLSCKQCQLGFCNIALRFITCYYLLRKAFNFPPSKPIVAMNVFKLCCRSWYVVAAKHVCY